LKSIFRFACLAAALACNNVLATSLNYNFTMLRPLPGQSRPDWLFTNAFAINDAGLIFGDSTAPVAALASYRPVMWLPTATGYSGPIDIGTLDGAIGTGYAWGISRDGSVIGFSQLRGVANEHSVTWDVSDLSHITITDTSGGAAIPSIPPLRSRFGELFGNNLRLTGTTELINLANLIDPVAKSAGWTITGARAINNAGTIVGDMYNPISGGYGSYVMRLSGSPTSPVPEPSTYGMLLLGLAFTGAAIRRKQS
jgi:hypothetical protein